MHQRYVVQLPLVQNIDMFSVHQPNHHHAVTIRGFTLIELMMAVAILGVLAALAAPSFNDTIKRRQTAAIMDELMGSIEVARTESRRRGRTIFLSRHTNSSSNCPVPTTPATDPWQCWQISIDTNNNQVLDGTEGTSGNAVQVFTAPPNYRVQPSPIFITFNRWGQALNTPQFIVYQFSEGVSASTSRTVCVSIGGKMTTKSGGATCT
jgi:type IV fimbrial biogenesis protein FimT